jgi:hypothetical protein
MIFFHIRPFPSELGKRIILNKKKKKKNKKNKNKNKKNKNKKKS